MTRTNRRYCRVRGWGAGAYRAIVMTGILLGPVGATAGVIPPVDDQVKRWNWFADKVFALHEQQLKDRSVRREERTGGYAGMPGFYREVTFYDAKTGDLLSRVQWETAQPQNVHSLEVYVRDKKGRVIRDYGASYLPTTRNAPIQTLINLHGYADGLHAFREFDASGNRIFEKCTGQYKGKDVELALTEEDFLDQKGQRPSALYNACFEGIATSPGEFFRPH